MTGNAYRGRSASKRQWFYGFKVQVIITSDGVPVEFYVHAGSEADITGLRAMAVDLLEGSVLYTDNAYTDYALEDLFAEACGNQQVKRPVSRTANGPTPRLNSVYFSIFARVWKPPSANSPLVAPSIFMLSRRPVSCSN